MDFPAWLDEQARTEQQQLEFWLHARMSEACGDGSLASELVAAGADYRQVAKAHASGASGKQLRRIFA